MEGTLQCQAGYAASTESEAVERISYSKLQERRDLYRLQAGPGRDSNGHGKTNF